MKTLPASVRYASPETKHAAAQIAKPAPRYVIASLPAWREAAAQAIKNGKSEADFLATCHPDNFTNARNAYRMERAAKPVSRTVTGTSHFESSAAAIAYYRPCEGKDAAFAVAQKIAEGQIHIGPPKLKPGQTLSLHREERRYFITEERAEG